LDRYQRSFITRAGERKGIAAPSILGALCYYACRKPHPETAMNELDRLNALRGAIGQFARAMVAGDVSALNSLLSPGYRHTDRFGKSWYRDDWLAQVRPDMKRATATDWGHFGADLMGDLGIVTGIRHLYGPDATEPRTAYTQLWIWRDERWQRALFQETPVVETEEP
jgi:hypothetical protein